jgi:hypothetical protein
MASAVWAAVISILSTDSFSSEHTSRFLVPLLRWPFPPAGVETLEPMHAMIRKTAHRSDILSSVLYCGTR